MRFPMDIGCRFLHYTDVIIDALWSQVIGLFVPVSCSDLLSRRTEEQRGLLRLISDSDGCL